MGVKTNLLEKSDKPNKTDKKQIQNDNQQSNKQFQFKSELFVSNWRVQNNIKLKGNDNDNNVFYPYLKFQDLKIQENNLSFLEKFKNPTSIQSQTWPIILNKRDCISIAETGSGKTLCYLLPALQLIDKYFQNIQILILSPTRELAQQIHLMSQECFGSKIKTVCIYGGVSKFEQIDQLEGGAQAIIGTPGRIKDLVEMKKLDLSNVSFVVVDEADKMLEQGFSKQLEFLFKKTPEFRQTVLFSATWPKEVQQFADQYIKDPITIEIGQGSANKDVTQIIKVLEPEEKNNKLIEILNEIKDQKIIIFTQQKSETIELEQFLIENNFYCVTIHGAKGQKQRDKAVELFRSGEIKILVATDLASRGLDIKQVDFVLNYTFPNQISTYVHRIGRTGRAGNKGISFTFFSKSDRPLVNELCQVIEEAGQQIPKDLEIQRYKTNKKKNRKNKKLLQKEKEQKEIAQEFQKFKFTGKKIKLN